MRSTRSIGRRLAGQGKSDSGRPTLAKDGGADGENASQHFSILGSHRLDLLRYAWDDVLHLTS